MRGKEWWQLHNVDLSKGRESVTLRFVKWEELDDGVFDYDNHNPVDIVLDSDDVERVGDAFSKLKPWVRRDVP